MVAPPGFMILTRFSMGIESRNLTDTTHVKFIARKIYLLLLQA
jgi:hypothetical protein